MTIGTAVSKRINDLLFERDWSLYKLCKESCIPLSTLTNLFNGHTKSPTLQLIYKLSDAFGISIIDFLNNPIFTDNEIFFE